LSLFAAALRWKGPVRFARQGPLCRPLISTCFSFVTDTSDFRARHYICSRKTVILIRRFSELWPQPGRYPKMGTWGVSVAEDAV